jgi:hypothetical protein
MLLFMVGHLLGLGGARTVGFGCVMACVCAIALIGRRLPSLGFQVPISWVRLGPILYPTAFGLALGAAVVTLAASPGTYVVLFWSLAAEDPIVAVTPLLAFAAGRAIPSVVLGLRALWTTEHFTLAIAQFHRVVPFLSLIEVAVLATMTTLVLVR